MLVALCSRRLDIRTHTWAKAREAVASVTACAFTERGSKFDPELDFHGEPRGQLRRGAASCS